MPYRTKTYIAADWDNDKAAVDQLYSWKNNGRLNLDFHDAHELTQARDTSLPCSIKSSLKTRMDVSKTFVMIVGPGTGDIVWTPEALSNMNAMRRLRRESTLSCCTTLQLWIRKDALRLSVI